MTTHAKSRPVTRPVKGKQPTTQRLFIWQNGKVKADATPDSVQEALRDPQALIWMDCEDDLAQSAHMLARTFKFSRITMETIGEEHERAKLSEGDGYFYLVTHGLDYDGKAQAARTPKLDIAFGANFVVTVHREAMPWLDAVRKTASARDVEEHCMSRGAAFLLYRILDALIDSYFPVLEAIDEQIDDLENSTVKVANDEVQAQIFRMKRTLVMMRRVISPQVEVANSLIARTGALIPAEIEPYFADVHDHLVRAFEVLDSYRDLMSGLLDVYLTTVSNRLNVVMKQLAIISTIFLPITFITGVFGMNFGHSPQVEQDNGSFFWYAIAAMGAITITQIWFFKKRGWF
jgi:magnesium transporter